ncbi:MAG TPA: glycosyltransferase family 2 protein [Blastocatellia bacterium]|nr:glycosyltransferase family 2 protein [Blastocatellia bacterium]
MRISATVITFNEEANIAAALESLAWADEIIVVDSESEDRTVEIARRFTDRIFVREWPGYSAQKNFAAEQASFDWIFSLDADERVSDALANELLNLKRSPDPACAAFEMPRQAFYMGRWIKHSGWYPDHKPRLYDKRSAGWAGEFVHESLEVKGSIERLRGDILHYTVRDASDHHKRIDRYTTLAARELFQKGRRATTLSLLISPIGAFLRSYVIKRGFLDGAQGLAIARFAAHYVFLRNLKLWEMRSNSSEEGPPR